MRALHEPAVRTGLSFAASDITLEEGDSQQDSADASQGEEVFKAPSEPASAVQSRKLANVRVQLDALLQQLQQQRAESKRREEALEQKRDEALRKRDEALEQQREESEKREKALERRLDEVMKAVSRRGKSGTARGAYPTNRFSS